MGTHRKSWERAVERMRCVPVCLEVTPGPWRGGWLRVVDSAPTVRNSHAIYAEISTVPSLTSMKSRQLERGVLWRTLL